MYIPLCPILRLSSRWRERSARTGGKRCREDEVKSYRRLLPLAGAAEEKALAVCVRQIGAAPRLQGIRPGKGKSFGLAPEHW